MKRLAFIPFVLAAVTAAGMFLEPTTGAMYHRVVLIAVAGVTAISAFLTTSRFSHGDRLHACWLLIGGGYALAAVRYILRVVTLLNGTVFPQRMLDAMLILQNVAIALALLLFVLAWRKTGLAAPGSRLTQVLSITAGIVIAVVAGGIPLLRGIANANADLVLLVSTLGDMVGLALIVPLAMSALAMRGGLLMHTWVYLAASEVAWLCYDLWYAFRPNMALSLPTGRGIEEAIRVVAILFAFAATVAQRRAIRV
jgi:hypothetical protein